MAVSVPTTFAVALLVNFLADFSLNRVTLFALIVALGLILGSLPLFVGLAITLPVLGHATWHVYRKLVSV